MVARFCVPGGLPRGGRLLSLSRGSAIRWAVPGRRPYSDELTYGPFSFCRRSERDFATLASSVGLKEFSLQFISKNSMNEMN